MPADQTVAPPAPPAHPDLSPLLSQGEVGVGLYTRVLLAMFGGATWRLAVGNADEWWLAGPGVRGTCWYLPATGRTNAKVALHDPLNDPAAAWKLETRELIGWTQCDGMHRYEYAAGRPFGPWHPNRARAAELAVLHKYENDERWAHLVRPLLARLS